MSNPSNSNWRDRDESQQNRQRRNKNNPNRGARNDKFVTQRKPQNNQTYQQGLMGDGDSSAVQPGKNNLNNPTDPQGQQPSAAVDNNNPNTSTTSSSSGSSSSPATVKSNSASPNSPTQKSTTESLENQGNANPTSDSNGNNSQHNPLALDSDTDDGTGVGTVQEESSLAFESASENEDNDVVEILQSANGHASANSKSEDKSFVEIISDEEEEDNESDATFEEGASVTHASLLVNVNDTRNVSLDFRSFTTSSPVESPLSSSRSAPPDISVDKIDVDAAEAEAPWVRPSLPPLAPMVQREYLELEQRQAKDNMNTARSVSPVGEKPAGYVPRKKNSVSFAANTIDILEQIGTRESPPASGTTAKSAAKGHAISPSILTNAKEGGGPITPEYKMASEDEESDEDLGEGASSGKSKDGDASVVVLSDSDSGEEPVFRNKIESVNSNANGSGDGGKQETTVPNPKPKPVPKDSIALLEDDLAADEEVQEINAGLELPITTTELEAPNGVKVYVVGTAHFSLKSQQDVIDTIQKVQPNVVVVELCQSRRNILTLDEETILREASDINFEKVRLAIRQSGTVQGLLHLLLLSMSAQITKKLGMAPGGEFRVSLIEARKIPHCLIYLGDRPFGITLSRAFAALTLRQKIKLCWQFLTNNEDITKEEIERCKEKDLLEKMLTEMTGEFPTISQVFVQERDIYLAHSLWGAAQSAHAAVLHGRQAGHATEETKGAVVGVVGMGHVAGIAKYWGKTTEEQIAEITLVPEPSLQSKIIRKTMKITFYALLGYGTYRFSRRFFDFPSDALISSAKIRIPELVVKPLQMLKK